MHPPPVRTPYAHDAVLAMPADGDERAPGGAITLAICGSWTHDPPCPLAPHHTAAERSGPDLVLRVLFAAAPADEPRVRRLIDAALAHGTGADPDGVPTSWRLIRSGASAVRAEEREHAGRLTQG